jgi:hypothetical protein
LAINLKEDLILFHQKLEKRIDPLNFFVLKRPQQFLDQKYFKMADASKRKKNHYIERSDQAKIIPSPSKLSYPNLSCTKPPSIHVFIPKHFLQPGYVLSTVTFL